MQMSTRYVICITLMMSRVCKWVMVTSQVGVEINYLPGNSWDVASWRWEQPIASLRPLLAARRWRATTSLSHRRRRRRRRRCSASPPPSSAAVAAGVECCCCCCCCLCCWWGRRCRSSTLTRAPVPSANWLRLQSDCCHLIGDIVSHSIIIASSASTRFNFIEISTWFIHWFQVLVARKCNKMAIIARLIMDSHLSIWPRYKSWQLTTFDFDFVTSHCNLHVHLQRSRVKRGNREIAPNLNCQQMSPHVVYSSKFDVIYI